MPLEQLEIGLPREVDRTAEQLLRLAVAALGGANRGERGDHEHLAARILPDGMSRSVECELLGLVDLA